MDLQKINFLKEKRDKLEKSIASQRKYAQNQANELRFEVEKLQDKIAQMNKEIERLSSNEVISENDREELGKVICDLVSETEKGNVYGIFNVRDVGEVLALLTSSITGIKYKFEIKKDFDGFACIRNYGIHFDYEFANISQDCNKLSPIRDFRFAEASKPTEKDNINYGCSLSGDRDGVGRTAMRILEETKQLTRFNTNLSSFEFIPIYGKEVPDFINDFLSYVSNYRMENDLRTLTKKTLNLLLQRFLATYGEKYTHYQEEQRMLEAKREEFKRRQQMEEDYRQKVLRRNTQLNNFKRRWRQKP